MEGKVPASVMLKSAATSGAILGLVAIIITVITYVTGAIYSPSSWTGVVSFVIMLVGVFLLTVRYRNTTCDGYITYGNALLYGWATYVVVGIISVIFTYLLQTVIEPDFNAKLMEAQREMYYEKGFNDGQIDQMMEVGKKFMTPGAMLLIGFISSVIMGLVISLITAIFAKKNKPVFE